MSSLKHDKKSMIEALSILSPSGVVELRALDCEPGSGFDRTVSGYFDHHHHEALADAAIRQAGGATGVYITLQEIKEDCLARACNRARPTKKKDPTTSDADVVQYRWLPLDFDPKKPAGVSSSEAEHEAAHAAARLCTLTLCDEGWPAPVYADSGNGAHVLYRLPDGWAKGSDGEKVKAVLAALIKRFSSEGVDLDAKVFNPARIWKLPGTVARKGDEIPSRPHRISKILSAPAVVEAVSVERLDALAAEGMAIINPPKPPPKPKMPTPEPGVSRLPAVGGASGKPAPEHEPDSKEKIEDALGHIPADDRDTWLHVGAALHHWGDPDARFLWDDWASSSGKYEAREQDKAWASFKDGGRSGKVRTLATIFKLAQENGWEHPLAKAKRERAAALKSNVVPLRPAPAPARAEGGGDGEPRGSLATKPRPAPVPVSMCSFDHQPNDMDLAIRFLEDFEAESDHPMVFDEGNLWRYIPDQGLWKRTRQADLTKHVRPWHGTVIINEKGKEEGKVRISAGDCKGAFWLAGQNREEIGYFDDAWSGVALGDGQFVRADVRAGKIIFAPVTPDCRARAALPCHYDKDAKGKLLDHYLSTVHAGHPDAEARVQLMGEIAFVALMGIGPKFGKAILAYGGQGTGKSQFLEILSGLVPADAQVSIQPHEIAHEYYGAELVGKLLNVVTECKESEVMSEAGFKAVVSGEQITRRHIRGEPFKFRPKALHVFAGNKLPPAPGATDAFWIRWMPIGFDRTFRETDKEIKDLGARIVAEEMDAVLAWAIRCGEALLERRRYTVPGSVEGLFKRWKTDSDSVAAWVEEDCKILPETAERKKFWRAADAHGAYIKYCETNRFGVANSRTFRQRLEALGVTCTMMAGRSLYGLAPRGDTVDTSDDLPI